MSELGGRIGWDRKSLRFAGQRLWVHDGELHYFRHPNELWRERLLALKRAGLNAVSTYVAWNFHEQKPGEFDFSGDHDFGRFMDLAGELGLYVMVRPGPYICGEWSGGGIPSWVSHRRDVQLRQDDPLFMEAVERWYAQLLPVIARRQITRGGPVITIQNENEYHDGGPAPRRNYLRKISDLFRAHGVEVPILACNAHPLPDGKVQINYSTDPDHWALQPEMIITYNCGGDVEPITALRTIQPDKPVFVTELWSGGMMFWGTPKSGWPPTPDLARSVIEMASVGAQVCFYMFDGGTNFGFWGGCNIATSYESDYPVREGGITGERYRALRPYNHFVSRFGDLLADSDPVENHGVIADPQVRLVVRQTPAGRILFVSGPDKGPRRRLSLPDGTKLELHFDDVPAVVLPLGLEVWPGLTLDYANMGLMLRDAGQRLLVLHGPAGGPAVMSANGAVHRLTVKRHGVHRLPVQNATVLILDTAMARRCWPDEDRLIIGPDYLGERDETGKLVARVGPSTPKVVVCTPGQAKPREVRFDVPAALPPLPELTPWRQVSCGEVGGQMDGWRPLDVPRCHDELGVPHGYVWFRAEAQAEWAGIHSLLSPAASSPVVVYANGQWAATVGEYRSVNQRTAYSHPSRRLHEAVAVSLNRGGNELVLLAEDSGDTFFHASSVGIQGPVFLDARPFEPRFEEEKDHAGPILSFELPLAPGERAAVQMLCSTRKVTVDGEPLPELSHPRDHFHGFLLPISPADASRQVRIHHAPGERERLLGSLSVHIVPQAGELRNWAWKMFDEPPDFDQEKNAPAACGGVVGRAPVLLAPTPVEPASALRRIQPRWFTTDFSRPTCRRPLFFQPGSMHKGQLYLNGRNAGRFWLKGRTQTHYYLPEPWLRDHNTLQVFEEQGLPPTGAALSWKEGGPWTDIAL